ncbi:MAG: DUF6713 family protein [Haloarculaceae archaeon]|jgi:hypothetical protein
MTPRWTDDRAFYAVLALLLGHELDAVARHEWRLLPVLRSLPDGVAGRLFVALHVPLCLSLFALDASSSDRTRRRFRLAVDAFAVVHAGLHVWFGDHPDDEFDAPSSRLLIHGAAAAGLLHGLLSMRNGERS